MVLPCRNDDQRRAISEINRVLVEGGVVYIDLNPVSIAVSQDKNRWWQRNNPNMIRLYQLKTDSAGRCASLTNGINARSSVSKNTVVDEASACAEIVLCGSRLRTRVAAF